jgi:hypothetical protein
VSELDVLVLGVLAHAFRVRLLEHGRSGGLTEAAVEIGWLGGVVRRMHWWDTREELAGV